MAQESWKRDTEETGCQPPEGPVLCTNGCGFFGSAATTNLCSKCYRDLVLKQAKATSAKAAAAAAAEKTFSTTTQSDFSLERTKQSVRQTLETFAPVTPSPSGSPNGGGTSSSTAANEQEQTREQVPSRCLSCKKRVGLTGFKCRCGNTFCSLHRYSDKHSCSFDYKAAQRDAIAKANPVVKADKIEKI